MQFVALQPVSMWTDAVAVVPNPEFEPSEAATGPPHVEGMAELEELDSPEGGTLYLLHLGLDVHADDDGPSYPYEIELDVSTALMFATDTGLDAEARREIVRAEGVALLYGYARAVILQHTGSGMLGPMMLPAIDLAEFARESFQDAGVMPSISDLLHLPSTAMAPARAKPAKRRRR